jgi:hypothetical protein
MKQGAAHRYSKVDKVLTRVLLCRLHRLLFATSKQSFDNLSHSTSKRDLTA